MTDYPLRGTASVPSDLKQQNRRTVLAFFGDNCEHTAAEIAAATGISKLTVMKAIQFFCDKGILMSSGKGSSTGRGGKRPVCYRFCYDKCSLHIAMWPGSLSFTLFRLDHTMIRQTTHRWVIPSDPKDAFAWVREYAADFLNDCGVSAKELYGVNLSTAGIVDYRDFTLLYSSQSPSWGTNIPVGAYLKDIFGPEPFYFVENTGKCIGRAAFAKQKDRSLRTLVLFTSWGISAALIREGVILNGRDSIIGEIGHMTLDPNDPEECTCGNHGCAERLLSLTRLIREISLDPPPQTSPLCNYPPELITLESLFAASRQNDPYARGKVRTLAGYFAALLRNTVLTFDPESVILVGDYAAADEYFRECVREDLSRFRYFTSGSPFEIRCDRSPLLQLDADGCAAAMLEHFISRPWIYEEAE